MFNRRPRSDETGDDAIPAELARRLGARSEHVGRQLGRSGLRTRRLSSQQLAELYLNTFRAESARDHLEMLLKAPQRDRKKDIELLEMRAYDDALHRVEHFASRRIFVETLIEEVSHYTAALREADRDGDSQHRPAIHEQRVGCSRLVGR